VRLAQIGLGRIGAFHAESLASRINGAELAWVVDADPARAEQLGRRFEVPWTSSYDEVLSDLAVDAVVIATPTPLHAEMIKGQPLPANTSFVKSRYRLSQAELQRRWRR
jgi:myo-inositol 2-dehydrogenase/D-chiro-inositol 1-dehydrogenase